MPSDKQITLNIKLTKTMTEKLEALAQSRNMTSGEFVQRILQNTCSSEFLIPDPTARQLAGTSAQLIHMCQELGEARRAVEQTGGGDPLVIQEIRDALHRSNQIFIQVAKAVELAA